MDNKAIYKKTRGFSLRRVLWDVLAVFAWLVLMTLGFFIGSRISDEGALLGLLIGGIIGIVLMIIILRFVSYLLKAGQIAMMTKGIVEGSLPDNVIAEGKKVVKERFLTVALYFAATKAIKGIFNQLGKAITNVAGMVGGDTGKTIGSAVNTVVQTIINYLSDCCLGWVFFRREVNAARATLEGAVLFFRHGKTFAKNMGRVFGMGLVSLLLIGGAFTGVFYAILSTQAEALSGVYQAVAEAFADGEGTFAMILRNPATIPLAFSIAGGVIIWSILHSTFVKPFVLTGVLRNYLQSGINAIPTEESFKELDAKSPKFLQLHNQL